MATFKQQSLSGIHELLAKQSKGADQSAGEQSAEVIEETIEETENQETNESEEESIQEETNAEGSGEQSELPESEDSSESNQESSEEESSEEESSGNDEEIDLDNIESWDDDSESTSEEELETVSEFDFSSIAQEFEITDVNNVEEFTSKLKDKIDKAKESALDELLPSEIKQIYDLYKEGIDFKTALGINKVDYDKVNDIDLVASSISNYFLKEDGSVDDVALDDYLENMSDVQLKIEADRVRKELKSRDEQAVNHAISQAQAKKQQIEEGVSRALKGFNEVAGFKVNAYQKENIKKSVVNDTLIQDLLFSNNKLDYEKAVKLKFLNDNFDKMVGFLKNKVRNTTKRDIIQSASNVEPPVSSTPTRASQSQQNVDPARKAQMDWIKALKGN